MVLSIRRSLVERDGAVSPHTHLGLRCRERRPTSTTGAPSPDRVDAKAARRTAPDVDTLHRPAGPARLPESARGRTYPGRGNDTGDNETDRNGGQGNDAGGHTHASACLLAARDAASLTPAFATHRPCRAITPHTLDA